MKAEIVGPVTRSAEARVRWQTNAITLAEKFRWYAETYNPDEVGTTPDVSHVEQEGPFTDACRWCEFKDWCRLGAHVETLPVMFEQNVWMPYDPRDITREEPK
jgi:hypothetical protein